MLGDLLYGYVGVEAESESRWHNTYLLTYDDVCAWVRGVYDRDWDGEEIPEDERDELFKATFRLGVKIESFTLLQEFTLDTRKLEDLGDKAEGWVYDDGDQKHWFFTLEELQQKFGITTDHAFASAEVVVYRASFEVVAEYVRPGHDQPLAKAKR